MKGVLFCAVLAFVAAVSCALPVWDEDPAFVYTHPDYGCVYTVKDDIKTLFTHMTVKFWVNKNMTRVTYYNHRGILLQDGIIRRDLPPNYDKDRDRYYYPVWYYSAAEGCEYGNASVSRELYDEDPVQYALPDRDFLPLVNATFRFPNKTSGTYDGKNYDIYYFDVVYFPDYHNISFYVDQKDNYVKVVTEDYEIVDSRTVHELTWDHRAAPEDFVFKKKYVYNCSNEAIFDEPTVQSAIMCAASVTKAAVAVVLASFVSVLIALF